MVELANILPSKVLKMCVGGGGGKEREIFGKEKQLSS